jgi:hypothetical protein
MSQDHIHDPILIRFGIRLRITLDKSYFVWARGYIYKSGRKKMDGRKNGRKFYLFIMRYKNKLKNVLTFLQRTRFFLLEGYALCFCHILTFLYIANCWAPQTWSGEHKTVTCEQYGCWIQAVGSRKQTAQRSAAVAKNLYISSDLSATTALCRYRWCTATQGKNWRLVHRSLAVTG